MMCKIDEWKNYMSWKERERSRSRDQDLLSSKKVTPPPPPEKKRKDLDIQENTVIITHIGICKHQRCNLMLKR